MSKRWLAALRGVLVTSLFGLLQLRRSFVWEDNWHFQLWLHLQQRGPIISVQSLCCPTQLAPWRRGFCVINSNNIDLQIIYPHKSTSSSVSSAFLLKDKTMMLNKQTQKRRGCLCLLFFALSSSKEQEQFLVIGLRTCRTELKPWLTHEFFKPLQCFQCERNWHLQEKESLFK